MTDDRLEFAPEQWVRTPDATDDELASGRILTERKRDDLTDLEASVRTLIRDAALAGQDLITLPTSALDILHRTRPGTPDSFPLEVISSIAVAEAADLADRFIDEPDTTRWPLLVRWPGDDV